MNKRHREIILYIEECQKYNRKCSLDRLIDHFHVSERTIRYDLDAISRFFTNKHLPSLLMDEDGNITYNYDLYTLKLISRANLEQQIKDNYSKWLNLAKETEYNKLAEEVRAKRDKLLADTDWTQVTDSALTKEKQEKYKEYRQKLRDITGQPEFPYNVTFPCI